MAIKSPNVPIPSPEEALKKLTELKIIFDADEFLKYVELRNTSIVELLLIAGMNPNLTNRSHWTALMLAANNGDIATVQALLYHHADPNIAEPVYGRTALSLVTEKNYQAIVQILKLAGARR